MVNTNGELLIANLLTVLGQTRSPRVIRALIGGFIGAYYGGYQFWVEHRSRCVLRLPRVAPREVPGRAGSAVVLPLIALGGYAIIAAGVGFAVCAG